MQVVGVDGFKDGWVAVELADGGFAEARCFHTLEEVVSAFPKAKAFGIDIPIGYPREGARLADAEARAALRERGRSVFDACPPALLECADYDALRALARERGLACPSRQSWALVPKMREAERMARADARLHEVHPEVSFMWMGGEPIAASKRTWNGFWRRHKLLAKQGIRVPADFDNGELVGIDDVLDAAAAAWSAHRVATGEARCYPARPGTQLDAYGRPVAIWY